LVIQVSRIILITVSMTENTHSNLSHSAELVVSAERHKQLQDIISYVKGIHYFIDPDMYRISMKQLEELAWCFEGDEFESEGFKECYGFKMPVSWDDLRFIESVVMAADTYSQRTHSYGRVEGITDQGFDDLMKWLARSEDALFRSKLKD
jgi:hypothetical protein